MVKESLADVFLKTLYFELQFSTADYDDEIKINKVGRQSVSSCALQNLTAKQSLTTIS